MTPASKHQVTQANQPAKGTRATHICVLENEKLPLGLTFFILPIFQSGFDGGLSKVEA